MWISIFNGCVQLGAGGYVRHWDSDLSSWRPGWGPWATHSAVGSDAEMLASWRVGVKNAHSR